MRRPLHYFAENTDRLRECILEHPDYPIVVKVDSDVVGDDIHTWWVAPCLTYEIGEFLNCCLDTILDIEVGDTNIFFDRDDFESWLQGIMECTCKYDDYTDEEFDEILEKEFHKFDECWTPVIIIKAMV